MSPDDRKGIEARKREKEARKALKEPGPVGLGQGVDLIRCQGCRG